MESKSFILQLKIVDIDRRRGGRHTRRQREDAMDDDVIARLHIREVVENWVIWRDSGHWERLRTCWHTDGRMQTVWFQGPADDFIAHAAGPRPRGGPSGHVLGGTSVDLKGERAIAESKVSIQVRATIEGVPCDVLSASRFYDFFERRAGRWAIVLRQVIYEKDRIDPIDPAATPPVLDPALLGQFPEGFRYFGYIQTRGGWNPKRDTPTLRSPEAERLYAAGKAWLDGKPLAWS
jgi:SnoaL-like domain